MSSGTQKLSAATFKGPANMPTMPCPAGPWLLVPYFMCLKINVKGNHCAVELFKAVWWFGTFFYFSIYIYILDYWEMLSSQLTFICFRGFFNHQPDKLFLFFVGVVAYGMLCFLPGREVTHELRFHTVVWLNVGPQSYRGWFITRLARVHGSYSHSEMGVQTNFQLGAPTL